MRASCLLSTAFSTARGRRRWTVVCWSVRFCCVCDNGSWTTPPPRCWPRLPASSLAPAASPIAARYRWRSGCGPLLSSTLCGDSSHAAYTLSSPHPARPRPRPWRRHYPWSTCTPQPTSRSPGSPPTTPSFPRLHGPRWSQPLPKRLATWWSSLCRTNPPPSDPTFARRLRATAPPLPPSSRLPQSGDSLSQTSPLCCCTRPPTTRPWRPSSPTSRSSSARASPPSSSSPPAPTPTRPPPPRPPSPRPSAGPSHSMGRVWTS
mmetsp:Transcript_3324/g.7070  ORF Transcript_3324/g.7070 Transcript_3324/m.7070 type:complete len:262 (+) Transcript_3324:464-1249(+)